MDGNNEHTESEAARRTRMRPFVVVGRWLLAVAVAGAAAMAAPDALLAVRFGAGAALSFAAANALWQHVPLGLACLLAFAASATFLAAAWLLAPDAPADAAYPLAVLAGGAGAAAGALVGYPALKRIDRIVNPYLY